MVANFISFGDMKGLDLKGQNVPLKSVLKGSDEPQLIKII